MSTMRLLSVVSLLILSTLHAEEKSATTSPKNKKILCFGGNGFIGAETLHRIITQNENLDENEALDITMVSRGSWPFDTYPLIRPLVHYIHCDRDDDMAVQCSALMDEIQATVEFYAVLDFSAYDPQWVQKAVDVLQGKVRVYIYVSTDSVYEVCAGDGYLVTGRKTFEADAVRPKDYVQQAALNADDEYGDEKLQGEEILVAQRASKTGFPYVFLRLADVIGRRDSSDRFVVYWLWLKYQHLHHVPAIHVPDNVPAEFASSMTYVDDVVASILAAMDNPDSWDEAYNIACEELFQLRPFLQSLAKLMHGDDYELKVEERDEEESFSMYPSVNRGPIDVSKALGKLGLTPTPMDTALKETVAWYEEVFVSNSDFRQLFLNQWIEYVLESDDDSDDDDDENEHSRIDKVLQAILNSERYDAKRDEL